MMTAYDFCRKKWDEALFSSLKEKLIQIQLIYIPDDMALLKKSDTSKTIVVQKNASVFSSLQILKMGFAHCLDSAQADFEREVLAACLMLLNPAALVDSKIPFFLRGMSPDSSMSSHSTTSISVLHRSEFPDALEELAQFFKKSPAASSHQDVINFTADEMVSNGLRAHLKAGFTNKAVELFAGFDNTSFVLGCVDFAGLLDRNQMLETLSSEFAGESITPAGGFRSAGIGLRLVVDGASSLYIHCVPGKKTIFGCGFKNKNMSSNSTQSKHIHFTNSEHKF